MQDFQNQEKKKEKEKGKVRDGQERNDVSQNWPQSSTITPTCSTLYFNYALLKRTLALQFHLLNQNNWKCYQVTLKNKNTEGRCNGSFQKNKRKGKRNRRKKGLNKRRVLPRFFITLDQFRHSRIRSLVKMLPLIVQRSLFLHRKKGILPYIMSNEGIKCPLKERTET